MSRVRTELIRGLILVGAVVLAGCTNHHHDSMIGNPMGPSGPGGTSDSFASNGERIYVSGVSSSAMAFTYTGGVTGMGRMGCATCHGVDGHGGTRSMMGLMVQAPDITWPALTGGDPDMEHPPYTAATLKAAITNGVDPAGHPLDQLMPHWSMSAADLDDLVGYLQTLH